MKPLRLIYYLIGIFFLTTAYYITGRFGLGFDPTSGFATLVWPPTGIAFASLYIFGIRFWPAILLGAFLVNFKTGAPAMVALGIGAGNMLESVVGAYIFKKFSGQDHSKILENLKSVFYFIFLVAILSTLISSILGPLSLLIGGIINFSSYFETFRSWWIGDILGDLIIGYFLIAWFSKKIDFSKIRVNLLRIIEFSTIIILLLSPIYIFIFNIKTRAPLEYLVFIPLIWMALRFGQRGVATSVIVFSIISIWGTVNGFGPFIQDKLSDSLLLLQLFMAVVVATGMILTAVTLTKKRLTLELEKEVKEIEQEKAIDDAILISIGQGLVVVDKSGKIKMVNRAFEDLLLWDKEEAIDRDINEVMLAEDGFGNLIALKDRVLAKILSGQESKIESNWYFIKRDKTKFPASFVATPIFLKGKIIGGVEVFKDITEEKELDKAKTEFVFLASHQLRTPLSSIKWYLEMLLAQKFGSFNEKQKKHLEVIYKSNERMISLIRSLLNVSRIELGRLTVSPELVDVKIMIKEVIEDQKPQIKNKKHNVSVDDMNPVPKIFTDRKLLKIVLQNIFSNAVKYTPAGGNINFSLTSSENNIKISCQDNGIGIPAKQQSKVFQKFFKADNSAQENSEGSGLGLYIAKAMVDALGGKIWFESQINKGTTFYFTLPLGAK